MELRTRWLQRLLVTVIPTMYTLEGPSIPAMHRASGRSPRRGEAAGWLQRNGMQ